MVANVMVALVVENCCHSIKTGRTLCVAPVPRQRCDLHRRSLFGRTSTCASTDGRLTAHTSTTKSTHTNMPLPKLKLPPVKTGQQLETVF